MSASNESFQAPPPPVIEQAPRAPRPTGLRPPAIALFVIGLLLIGGAIAKLLVGGIPAGIALVIFGIALFGLSFVPLPLVESKEPPLSTGETLIGIFYQPTRVFRDLRARPRWVAAFIMIAVLTTIYSALFVRRVTPERIVNFTIDKVAESGFIPPDRVEQARQLQLDQAKNPTYQWMSRVGPVVVLFVKYMAFAALMLLGVLAFGGRINFWQAVSAVIYAGLPWVVIHKVLSLVLLYVKSPDDIHPILNQETLVQDNLSVLVTPSEHPALFVLLSTLGVLWIYWVWLMAKGLRTTGTKVSGSAAWGVTITISVLMIIAGVIFATFFSAFFG
jgi:hypothetical protein